MCNACGNVCCGSDQFEKCGCDGCYCEACWSDDDLDGDGDDFDSELDGCTRQDCTPPELREILREALAKATPTGGGKAVRG